MLISKTTTTLTANGSTNSFDLQHVTNVAVYVEDSLGGGNVQLQASQDGGTTWHNVGSPIAAIGVSIVQCPGGTIKGVLAGATAPNTIVTFVR